MSTKEYTKGRDGVAHSRNHRSLGMMGWGRSGEKDERQKCNRKDTQKLGSEGSFTSCYGI